MTIKDESPQAKGGKARAEKMTADERKAVAQNAANKRWEKSKIIFHPLSSKVY